MGTRLLASKSTLVFFDQAYSTGCSRLVFLTCCAPISSASSLHLPHFTQQAYSSVLHGTSRPQIQAQNPCYNLNNKDRQQSHEKQKYKPNREDPFDTRSGLSRLRCYLGLSPHATSAIEAQLGTDLQRIFEPIHFDGIDGTIFKTIIRLVDQYLIYRFLDNSGTSPSPRVHASQVRLRRKPGTGVNYSMADVDKLRELMNILESQAGWGRKLRKKTPHAGPHGCLDDVGIHVHFQEGW